MADYPRTEPLFARTWRFPSEGYPSRSSLDDMLDALLPGIEALPGYRGVTVLVEHDTGAVLATVFWDSEEHLRAAMARETNAARGTLVLTGGDASESATHDVLINRPAPPVFDRDLGRVGR